MKILLNTNKNTNLIENKVSEIKDNTFLFKTFITVNNTVRPLLSAELDYPRFLTPNLSTPNLYEIQSDLYYSRPYYPRTLFICSF